MQDNFMLSLTTLLTGFVVVFALLLLLIGVIKLYGTIVYSIENRNKKSKDKEQSNTVTQDTTIENVETFSNSLSGEIIAVISAAVDSLYGPGKVKVKAVKKTSNNRSAWRTTGVIDNTRPF